MPHRNDKPAGTVIFGLGRSGLAVLEYLSTRAEAYPLWVIEEQAIAPDILARFEPLGVHFVSDGQILDDFCTVKSVIVSPGVNAREPRFDVLRLAGVEIMSELEFACRLLPKAVKIVAITGTNGKSTTTSLIHHLLISAQRRAIIAGNIGIPLTTELASLEGCDVVVLEVSSFQLEEIHQFHPHLGLILNLTPDHLDRYPSLEEYFKAKIDGFRNQQVGDYLILNADDSRLRAMLNNAQGYRPDLIAFSRLEPLKRGASLKGERIQLDLPDHLFSISTKPMTLQGVHNLENTLAAALAVALLGLNSEEIEAGLSTFIGLAHRMEMVGHRGGIEFINDSKATNIDAAQKSLLGFSCPVALILGGKDKSGEFARLCPLIEKNCALVILMGQASAEIGRQLASCRVRMVFVENLHQAVGLGAAAIEAAGGRGVVLLSPACASFDMFKNFEDRGDQFRLAVQEYLGG